MSSEFNEDDRISWSTNELRMLKYMLEQDGMQFMRYFFRNREGMKMLRNWHHYAIEFILQHVLDLKINRLIVNIAPGYSKTEQIVLNFIARAIALHPDAKFIHASYSGDLAQENSSKIKDMITSPEYQELWPMNLRVDKQGKKRWFTEFGGGMMAVPSGGQITGFRAGRMHTDRFTGAFVIDDPVKPDDAFSDAKRTSINKRFNNTMRSRLAVETVPMVIVMQRIHEDDLTGYLLKGGSGDKWHHVSIPTNLDAATIGKEYPKDFTHGIPIKINDILAAIHRGTHLDL